MTEHCLREQMVLQGRSLFERGFTCGSSGNLSVRLGDTILVTPTNSCLGRLQPEKISQIDFEGNQIDGDQPSKEAFLHLAMYQQRPNDRAVIHLHSTYAVAVSCLDQTEASDVLPPITPYYVMRIGQLPLVPYHAPGDRRLVEAVANIARRHHALLLANHGSVVAGKDLESATYAAEELEETAKLYLLLANRHTRYLSSDQVADLRKRFQA